MCKGRIPILTGQLLKTRIGFGHCECFIGFGSGQEWIWSSASRPHVCSRDGTNGSEGFDMTIGEQIVTGVHVAPEKAGLVGSGAVSAPVGVKVGAVLGGG